MENGISDAAPLLMWSGNILEEINQYLDSYQEEKQYTLNFQTEYINI